MESRVDDPCGRAGATLGRQRDVVQHMPALPHGEVAAAMSWRPPQWRWVPPARQAAAKLAFEFLVLTTAPSGEVRGALWSEIDLDASVWTVPPRA